MWMHRTGYTGGMSRAVSLFVVTLCPWIMGAAMAALIFGCSSRHPVPGSAGVAVDEPVTPAPGTGACDAAQAQLKKLDCRDPKGDPMWVNRRGEEFADTCRRIQTEGGIFIDPACIAGATTCEEANTCPAK